MDEARLALLVHKADSLTVRSLVTDSANRWLRSSSRIPALPSWVLITRVSDIPVSSPYNMETLLQLAEHDVELAYWLHTPEAWRAAVSTHNESIGRRLRRPSQYTNRPTDDTLSNPQPYTPLELNDVISHLAGPHHRLFNNVDPAQVLYSTLDDHDHVMIGTMFRYHYWVLMESVLVHRWDLVEYLINVHGWTEGELGTVLETLPRGVRCQPHPVWFEFWYHAGIARVPVISLLKRADMSWFYAVWMRCCRPGHPYVITPLDCWQLQQLTAPELQYVVFSLPNVDWSGVIRGYTADALKAGIRERKFRIRFADRPQLLVPRVLDQVEVS